jgi:tRNA(fMet)-specific endonuclease VapC
MQLRLIDTDILSEFLKQKNATVEANALQYLAQHQQFSISSMTRYEIIRGLKDKGATRQLQRFDEFCNHSEIIPITDAILDRTAELWVSGRQGGHPHRDPDLIIAATAIEFDRVLVTGNASDFRWIANLTIEDWREPTST